MTLNHVESFLLQFFNPQILLQVQVAAMGWLTSWLARLTAPSVSFQTIPLLTLFLTLYSIHISLNHTQKLQLIHCVISIILPARDSAFLGRKIRKKL